MAFKPLKLKGEVEDIPKIELKITPEVKLPNIRQPTLFEINQSFDYIKSDDGQHDGIKGEYSARMVVFTNFVLGRKPVILVGNRSSGKTAIMSIIKSFVKTPMNVSKASDKADFRDFENLNQASHFFVPEINKVNDNFIEVMKDLGEGVRSEYKFTDIDKIPRTIYIEPKPFITSIASENKNTTRLGEELMSRLTKINTDSSIDQNLRVIRYMLDKAQNPYKTQVIPTERIQELINYVKEMPNINEFVFIYLPGKSVVQAIPPLFTDSRRDTQKYIANTKGITLFHIKDRMIVDFNKKQNILVTPADAWYNHRIYNEILIQSSLKLGPVEQSILDIIRGETELLSAVEIRNKVLKQKIMASNEVVKKACDGMAEVGYLTKIEDQRPFKYILNPVLETDYTGWVNWKDVVDECKRAVNEQFPEQAEEYIKRFCGDKIWITDPFDGKQVNILDQKPLEVKKKPVIKDVVNTVSKDQDETEILRDKITELVKVNKGLIFDELCDEVRKELNYDDEVIEGEVNYLKSMNDLIVVEKKIMILE